MAKELWIVSCCNSEGNGIKTKIVKGTKAMVKQLLYEMAKDLNKEEEWDCGPENQNDTDRETDSYIYYGPWWGDHHVDLCAKRFDDNTVIDLSGYSRLKSEERRKIRYNI